MPENRPNLLHQSCLPFTTNCYLLTLNSFLLYLILTLKRPKSPQESRIKTRGLKISRSIRSNFTLHSYPIGIGLLQLLVSCCSRCSNLTPHHIPNKMGRKVKRLNSISKNGQQQLPKKRERARVAQRCTALRRVSHCMPRTSAAAMGEAQG